MLMVTFLWCWVFLLAVDELWTFSWFERSSILVRETNPTKHLQWFLLIPSASLSSLDVLTSYLPSQLLDILLLALPGARGRRNMKTNNSQASNTQLERAGASACWSQLWIKDCRESNYLAPCLGLFHLRFSSALRLPRQCPWLPYLQALIQGLYLLFEAQTACKDQGQQRPQDHDAVWPMDEGGDPHLAFVDYFLMLRKYCTRNLKLGAFKFVWQSLKSLQSKQLWGGSADILLSPTLGSSFCSWAVPQ